VADLTTPDRASAVTAYVERASHLTELDRQAEAGTKTGEFTGAYAINPGTGTRIPIWIADYVLVSYGTGALMAVPYGDERDFEFAAAFGLDVVPVVLPPGADHLTDAEVVAAHAPWTGPGTLINSGPISGAVHNDDKGRASPAIAAAIDHIEALGAGSEKVTYRLRDWLISRQRYWGTPIPILYCAKCGVVAEREENLPVRLPTDVAFMPTGESPLKSHRPFIEATCPTCGGPAQRETDTMDTFMDSSWYWFRYLSPHDDQRPLDPLLANRWTPVDMYTGGIEHAILHLLYARFFTKALRDLGLIEIGEPFKRLRNQGIILGEDNEKMSKSRGNTVNPDPLVKEYGADVVRAYLMFIGPWDQGGPWNYNGIEGIARFLNRVWSLVVDAEPAGKAAVTGSDAATDGVDADRDLTRAVNYAIKEVTDDLEGFRFNTAIAELMSLLNVMVKAKASRRVSPATWSAAVEAYVLLMAPFTPHIAEELWERTGHADSVHLQAWPDFDPAALVEDTIQLAVQVNGKVRGQIKVPATADEATVLAAARTEENVARHIAGQTVVREIVVPGRLVSFVVKG
ncbi:MAG TPA: leucine--tRNA ligase, partial [Trueperaceae bacterium]|nr:leucine--tRNA ligase [Trueperaceae bacterium]